MSDFCIQGSISEDKILGMRYHLLTYKTGVEMTNIDLLLIRTKVDAIINLQIPICKNTLSRENIAEIASLDVDFEFVNSTIVTINKKYTLGILKDALCTIK